MYILFPVGVGYILLREQGVLQRTGEAGGGVWVSCVCACDGNGCGVVVVVGGTGWGGEGRGWAAHNIRCGSWAQLGWVQWTSLHALLYMAQCVSAASKHPLDGGITQVLSQQPGPMWVVQVWTELLDRSCRWRQTGSEVKVQALRVPQEMPAKQLQVTIEPLYIRGERAEGWAAVCCVDGCNSQC